MIFETMQVIIGVPPLGYEFMEYILASVFFLWMCKQVLNLFYIPLNLGKLFGEKR